MTCLLFCAGCGFEGFLKKQLARFTPKEADKFARSYIDILLKGDIEKAEKLLDPKVVNSKTQSQLQNIANLLDKGKLISTESVGVNMFRNRDRVRNTLTYQLQFEDVWLLAIVTVDGVSGNQKIYRFHVKPIPKSLKEINAFTFSDKSFRHYIILLIAIGIPVFIIYTIVLCARTKMKRKWLWIIVILLGVGRCSFNWTSGQMVIQLIFIQLIPTSAFKGGPYAPWIINISVPVGALLFLMKRRKIMKSISVEVPMVPDSDNVVKDQVDSELKDV
ncbi:MAG: hypothetical protein GY845_20135 [Planctomycetes bacterium]|nr:hypothetical protein [Planctomycetota bacterium]